MASEFPRLVRGITVERLDKFTSKDFFADVNLFSALYKKRTDDFKHVRLQVHSVQGLKRIPFDEAIKKEFRPASVGDSFGPSWSTHWFHIVVNVPNNWVDEEVQFLWNSDNEGLIWSKDGVPLQGLTGGGGLDRRVEYILTPRSKGGEKFEFYIEMACNGMFGVGDNGLINAPDPRKYYTIREAALAVPNKAAWELWYDFQIIRGMAKDMPHESIRAAQALYAANEIANAFHPHDDHSIQDAIKIAKEFLKDKNGSTQHQLIAVGHCHIDTAWLWPFDETKRKVARSWSTQVDLMDRYPEFKFVCSQAQQFEWLKEYYPKLFHKVQEKAKKEQFLPIGGVKWTKLNTSSLLVRQRFFEKHFGKRCKVFWLPDTFGYSAQLPQIIRSADMKYFFTQKLSWNNINKFPNTTFYWVGLDGTKVLTHMCPSETYVAQGTVDELIKSVTNNKDREYTNESLLDGLPKVEMGSADDFYERLEKNSKKLITWKGELYFELHRGTYTSHGRIKRYNRKSELLLRDIELLSCLTQIIHNHFKYPKEKLDKLWKYVLLNQFHDVLPGSSIEMVYDDAYLFYDEVEKTGVTLRDEALDILFGISKSVESKHKGLVAFNTLSWERNELVKVSVTDGLPNLQQYSEDKKEGYAFVKNVIGIGAQPIDLDDKSEFTPVTAFENGHDFVLQNEFISVTFDKHGHLTRLFDRKLDREVIPEGEFGNRFKIYEDIPLFWDAWDVEIYHLQKGRDAGLGHIKIHEQGPLRASLKLETKLTKTSSLTQIISLSAISARIDFETEIDWDENRQFLKVEFPVDINRDVATYETQFGFIQRPTHYNTTWDAAKFEVCGHKFADLSEYGYGVALLNDSKYGYSIHNNIIRLSLLRSPKAPDAHCDIGHHVFKYALLPHANSFLGSNVVREAYQFNVPLIVRSTSREISASIEPKSYFKIDDAENVILDTIKRAEDSDEIVLRLFEAYGGHAKARLRRWCNSEVPPVPIYYVKGDVE
ncbi:8086_t:CDS:10, partial [Ambispora leptoticha]